MVKCLDDLFRHCSWVGYRQYPCTWFFCTPLTAHSWQFKCGSTNIIFQQQEVCLWHLAFALVSHEAVHHTDSESSKVAVAPQELQKDWYSRIWSKGLVSWKITENMLCKYSMDGITLLYYTSTLCTLWHLIWVDCLLLWNYCKILISVQFDRDLPSPQNWQHCFDKTPQIFSLSYHNNFKRKINQKFE